MSLSLPTPTSSGEDLKRRPTNSYQFGCLIRPWAVIPSNRMEWMRSCCHTNSSRPPHKFGRSVCLFIVFFPLALPGLFIPRVFLWIPSTLRPLPMYACFSILRRMFNRVPLPLLGSSLVNLPTRRVCFITTLVHAHTCTYPLLLFLLYPTNSCRRCSESSSVLPSLCCAPVVIIIACTTSLPPPG